MKLFDFSKERIPFYISLVAVLALGCIYYFAYLPKNEADINLWKFRTLQKIDRNIQTKIEIGQNQLNTYLKSIAKGTTYESLNEFLKSQHTANFPIGEITIDSNSRTKIDDILGLQLKLNSSERRLCLTQKYFTDPSLYTLSLDYYFEDFIKPLLSKQVFDQYIIITDSTILFETFPSGMDVAKDSTLKKKGNLTGAAIIDREYGGVSYKLFVQPVKLKNDNSIRVIGLLTNDHFYHTKTRLPPRYILFLITIFACILVTFPIVKLYQLADEDRLTLYDALSIVIVCMFLMSMLFLVFIKYSHSIIPDDQKSKRVLSSYIKDEFLREIRNNYDLLTSLDSLRSSPGYDENFYGINKENSRGTIGKREKSGEISCLLKDVDLGRIFWLDNFGIEKRTWNFSSVKVLFEGDFSSRDYFKKIINGQSYEYENNSDKKFFVEPIISFISGNFRTDISIPSKFKSAKVAVISFRIKSLNQAKVPPGYTFAMINEAGDVLYHSDSTKNLNENLFEEFSDSGSLKYSVKTNSSKPFNTQYYGKEYSVFVSPVGGGIPYYLVILENLAFDEYRDVNVFTFTISMQLMVFMLVVIQILIIFLASAKRSPFKNKLFETGWIGPKEASNWEYINCVGFNTCVFIGLWFIRHENFLPFVLMLFSAVSSIPLFLNVLFVQKYYRRKTKSLWYKAKAGGWGATVLIVLNLVASNVLEESWTNFWTFELCYILFPALIFLVFHWLLCPDEKHGNTLTRNIKFNQSYTVVLFSWMLIAMGLPVIIFFRLSYNYDQHIIARYNQANVANTALHEVRLKFNENQKNKLLYNQPMKEVLSDFIYSDSLLIRDVSVRDTTGYTDSYLQHFENPEYLKGINLLQTFHIYRGESLLEDINLNKATSGNAHFNTLMIHKAAPMDKTVTHVGFEGNYLRFGSASLNLHKPRTNILDISWWLSFFTILVASFFVLYGLINKIFSIKMCTEHADNFNENNLINMLSESHVFLVGFLKIGKYELIDYLADLSKVPGIKRVVFDFSQMLDIHGELTKGNWDKLMNEAYRDKYRLVVLCNFEYGFKNLKASQFKLSFLENLLNKASKTRILIQSTVNPGMILEMICKSEEKNVESQTIDRWHNVISKFIIELDQVSRERSFEMLNVVPNEGKEDGFIYESLVSYYHFYFSIWQTLTKEEKFFMYDLAEDGLVNCYDKYTLSLLLNKGLIVYKNGRLRLFTKGFRNFIIAGLGELEMAKLIEKINDNSHWNKTRLPLVIILMAILIFILSSQHETSTKLITTLGALSAAIPALISFLSTLGGINSAKK